MLFLAWATLIFYAKRRSYLRTLVIVILLDKMNQEMVLRVDMALLIQSSIALIIFWVSPLP
jgi:hypothetical protein